MKAWEVSVRCSFHSRPQRGDLYVVAGSRTATGFVEAGRTEAIRSQTDAPQFTKPFYISASNLPELLFSVYIGDVTCKSEFLTHQLHLGDVSYDFNQREQQKEATLDITGSGKVGQMMLHVEPVTNGEFPNEPTYDFIIRCDHLTKKGETHIVSKLSPSLLIFRKDLLIYHSEVIKRKQSVQFSKFTLSSSRICNSILNTPLRFEIHRNKSKEGIGETSQLVGSVTITFSEILSNHRDGKQTTLNIFNEKLRLEPKYKGSGSLSIVSVVERAPDPSYPPYEHIITQHPNGIKANTNHNNNSTTTTTATHTNISSSPAQGYTYNPFIDTNTNVNSHNVDKNISNNISNVNSATVTSTDTQTNGSSQILPNFNNLKINSNYNPMINNNMNMNNNNTNPQPISSPSSNPLNNNNNNVVPNNTTTPFPPNYNYNYNYNPNPNMNAPNQPNLMHAYSDPNFYGHNNPYSNPYPGYQPNPALNSNPNSNPNPNYNPNVTPIISSNPNSNLTTPNSNGSSGTNSNSNNINNTVNNNPNVYGNANFNPSNPYFMPQNNTPYYYPMTNPPFNPNPIPNIPAPNTTPPTTAQNPFLPSPTPQSYNHQPPVQHPFYSSPPSTPPQPHYPPAIPQPQPQIQSLPPSQPKRHVVDKVVFAPPKAETPKKPKSSNSGSSNNHNYGSNSVTTGKWYWKNDQSEWVEYDATVSERLEKGYKDKESRVRVDGQRFVEIGSGGMTQKRYDDENKVRTVKREEVKVERGRGGGGNGHVREALVGMGYEERVVDIVLMDEKVNGSLDEALNWLPALKELEELGIKVDTKRNLRLLQENKGDANVVAGILLS